MQPTLLIAAPPLPAQCLPRCTPPACTQPASLHPPCLRTACLAAPPPACTQPASLHPLCLHRAWLLWLLVEKQHVVKALPGMMLNSLAAVARLGGKTA